MLGNSSRPRRVYQVIAAATVIFALLIGAYAAKRLVFSGASTISPPTAAERQTLALLNAQRKRFCPKCTPLRYDATLAKYARAHNADMAKHDYFDHNTPGGPTYAQRVNGLLHQPGRSRLEENIAWGGGPYGTPQGLVTAWMNSPGHRANILNPGVHRAGEANLLTKKTYQGQPSGVVIATTDFSN